VLRGHLLAESSLGQACLVELEFSKVVANANPDVCLQRFEHLGLLDELITSGGIWGKSPICRLLINFGLNLPSTDDLI
jgi:hypothetical protein